MAEFENFESAGDATVEEDPAAAFLAREQTQLAGLEDDNFAVEEAAPSNTVDDIDGFEEPASAAVVDDVVELDVPQTNGPTDGGGYAAIAQVDKHRREPEKIKMWREEQLLRLEQKDLEEENRKTTWREAAKKELEDWQKHHAEQLVKTKENNRAAAAAELAEITCGDSDAMEIEVAQEEASIKDREESIAGQEWEKICRLCDFNPKHSKNTKDVSRMRSILLQLKQTPLVH